jgi:hypothetical protein
VASEPVTSVSSGSTSSEVKGEPSGSKESGAHTSDTGATSTALGSGSETNPPHIESGSSVADRPDQAAAVQFQAELDALTLSPAEKALEERYPKIAAALRAYETAAPADKFHADLALRREVGTHLDNARDWGGPVENGDARAIAVVNDLRRMAPRSTKLHEVVLQSGDATLVAPKVSAIEDTYAAKGGRAAAFELSEQIKNSPAELARAVLGRALPTIKKMVEQNHQDGFTLFHVSVAAERARTATGGSQIVSDIASIFVNDMQNVGLHSVSIAGGYLQGIDKSAETGHINLPIEIISQLKQSGRMHLLRAATGRIFHGTELLRSDLKAKADDLLPDLGLLSQLRERDLTYIPEDRLDAGFKAYVERHYQEFETKFNEVSLASAAAARTMLALDKAQLPELKDLLTSMQNDKYVRLGNVNSPEVAKTVRRWAEIGNEQQDLSAPYTRQYGAFNAALATTLADVKISKSPRAGLNGIPNIAGIGIYSKWQYDLYDQPVSAENLVFQSWAALGLAKETAETAAFAADKGWLGLRLQKKNWPQEILRKSPKGAQFYATENWRSWAMGTHLFNNFGTGLDVYLANKAFTSDKAHSTELGLFYSGSALSGVTGTFAPLAPETSPLAIWGPRIAGFAGVAVSLGIAYYQDLAAAAEYERPAKEILELSGIRADVAGKLANYDSSGRSIGPIFRVMQQEAGISPENFEQFLNGLSGRDVERLGTFVLLGRRLVRADDQGQFPRTHDNDIDLSTLPTGRIPTPVLDNYFVVPQEYRELFAPRSLNAMFIWGNQLFGDRFPGPAQLSDSP